MQGWVVALLVAALASAAAVGIAMWRSPILTRMAVRNAVRRPRQTGTVIAGLMVGTAIVSAALVAGGSAAYAIRGYVYQSLGHIDESVSIEGYPYFSQSVYDRYLADPAIADHFDGVSANAIWEAAAESDDLFQPSVAVVGFDPGHDARFGDFKLRGGGSTDGRDLAPGKAILTGHLADAIDARPGDVVRLSYTPPVDPILPEVFDLNGTVAASAGPKGPLGLPLAPIQPVPSTHAIPVNTSAARLTVIVGWEPSVAPGLPPTTALQVDVRSPDGHTYGTNATPGQPEVPLVLNVTAPLDGTLAEGVWAVTVSSPAAAGTPYRGLALVAYPVYDLAQLRQRAQALQDRFGGDHSFEGLDPASAFSERRTKDLEVAAVTTGGRGDQFDFRDAVFVRLDEAQEMFDRQGQVNLVKFSNPGGIEEGAGGTDEALDRLNATLDAIKAEHPDVAALQSLEVQPLKRTFVAVADEAGQTLTGLLVFAGSLSIITGLLLILNIFTMLAEERRSELGMARAVGLTRGDLVRLFTFEGSLYAVLAAALGSVLGLGLAYVMIEVLNAIIARVTTELSFPPIPFRPELWSLLVAFSIGALLTFLTILGASRRQSRLNVVRAIRRIEEPEKTGDRLRGLLYGIPLVGIGLASVVLGTLGNAVTRAVAGDHAFSLQVFGSLLAVIGLGLALRADVPRRRLAPSLAGLLAIYYTYTYFAIQEYSNPSEANVVGPVRGVLLTLCVVVLVVHWNAMAAWLGRTMARTRRLRAVALPAMSYPLHRKFRTGMTLAMFSVVILSIGFFSIFGALFQTDPDRQTGGYSIEARTTLSVPDLAQYDRGLVPAGTLTARESLVAYVTEDPGFITVSGDRPGTYGETRQNVFGYDPSFASSQRFRLLFRDENYTTDEEAYRAVAASSGRPGDGPALVITSYQYSTNSRNQDLSHTVGETLTMHLGEESLEFRIVGIQEQYHHPGIFLPKPLVKGLFPTTEDLYLYRTADGVDAEETARLLEQNYREVGMDAQASREEVLREQESFRQILGAMKLFLGLGLVVGVLSLGIITSRSVLERRQEIGMLRALGFTGSQVRGIFFIEVSFTLLLGALIGLACAVVVTYGLWFSIIRELNYPYVIPWGEIAILLVVSYAVALMATAAPIRRSSKVAPAEALRYLD
ncbi:MAG TPA: FtsX-like permease family protein [Candidatus Thermoplasmatota archaeon]|nr:FtsX-like permease family protein [Candidatus Thermoplasmatota archaeon]